MEQLSRELFKELKRNGRTENREEISGLMKETVAKIAWTEAGRIAAEGEFNHQDNDVLICEVLSSLLQNKKGTGKSRLSNEFSDSGCNEEKDVLFFLIQQVRKVIKTKLDSPDEN